MPHRRIVLITGSRSFTGQHLVPILQERGFEVVGIERSASSDPCHREFLCDLTNPICVEQAVQEIQPSHVIHLAALSFAALEEELPYYLVNVFGTQHLLRSLASLPTPPEKVILASSATVYGPPPVGTEVLGESIPPNPVNHYAISKLAMECMAKTWFATLPILLTRPFNYTGRGQDPKFVIPKIVHHFKARLPRIEVGNIDVYRDFSDVRDIARCYADLLASPHHSDVVNLCSGVPHQLREVFHLLAELTGHSLEIAHNPAFMRSQEVARLTGDASKLRHLIGYAPTTPLRETLAWMLEE